MAESASFAAAAAENKSLAADPSLAAADGDYFV